MAGEVVEPPAPKPTKARLTPHQRGGQKIKRRTEREKARLRRLLTPPDDELVVNGVDMSLDVQHPRDPGPPVTVASIIASRVARLAQVMDGSTATLQRMAKLAEKTNDLTAATLIHGKLMDHAAKVLTSTAATSIRPEGETINLDEFTPETRELLMTAFAAVERERRAKGESGG